MAKHNKTLGFFRHLIFCVLMVGLFTLSTIQSKAAESAEEQELVDKAVLTLKHFLYHPDMGFFPEYLKKSVGVLIVPTFIKAGLVLGGAGGQGVLSVRDEKTGEWSEPAFYTLGSGSLGLQIGVQVSEVILLVKKRDVIDSMYASSVKLGGDISVAAGPAGRGAAAKGLNADMISFALSKGVFAGISVEGAVIATRETANDVYYGTSVTPVEIILLHKVSNPHSAQLRETLTDAFNSAKSGENK
jgi:lipid-binding SYLF domain-containing protein